MNEYIKEAEKTILALENQSKLHWLRGEDDKFNRLLVLISKAKENLEQAKASSL